MQGQGNEAERVTKKYRIDNLKNERDEKKICNEIMKGKERKVKKRCTVNLRKRDKERSRN